MKTIFYTLVNEV